MLFDKDVRSQKRNKKLLSLIAIPDTGELLDMSCGDGKLLKSIKRLKPRLKLSGIDISDQELGSEINFHKSNAESIPFPDKTFDVIVCSMSLHHYKNLNAILNEIKRVLKTGGILYVLDIFPANQLSQRLYNLIGCREPYHFEKFYTTEEFTKLVEQYNLKLNITTPTGSIPRLRVVELNN